jgi:hypothetical protein
MGAWVDAVVVMGSPCCEASESLFACVAVRCRCAIACGQFRNNLFLGSTRLYLTALKDADHHNLYSKISGIIVPLGFLFVTVVGFIMDKLVGRGVGV